MSDPRWDELEAVVLNNKAAFKEAETAQDIRDIAGSNGVNLDDKQDFGKFVHKLKIIGVRFYDLLDAERAEAAKQKDAAIEELNDSASDAPTVPLWVAAIEDTNTGKGSFAVVDQTGEVVWANTFFDDDYTRKAGDVRTAEQSAAEKAVFIARKVQEATNLPVLRAVIYTQYPELDTALLRRKGLAGKSKIAVDIVVDADDDRAFFAAQDNVDRNWKTADLTTLVES